jgi:hypothetical protein
MQAVLSSAGVFDQTFLNAFSAATIAFSASSSTASSILQISCSFVGSIIGIKVFLDPGRNSLLMKMLV